MEYSVRILRHLPYSIFNIKTNPLIRPLLDCSISGLNSECYCIFWTVPEFEVLLKQEETYDPTKYMYEIISGQCYDHVWVAALALNCTDTYLKATGECTSRRLVGTRCLKSLLVLVLISLARQNHILPYILSIWYPIRLKLAHIHWLDTWNGIILR